MYKIITKMFNIFWVLCLFSWLLWMVICCL